MACLNFQGLIVPILFVPLLSVPQSIGQVSIEYRDDLPDRPQGAIEFHASTKSAAGRVTRPSIVAGGGVVSDVFTSSDYSNCTFIVMPRQNSHQRQGKLIVKFLSGGKFIDGVSCPLQYYPTGGISVGSHPLAKQDEFLVGGMAEDSPRDRMRPGASPVEIFAINESSGDVRMGNEFDLLVGCTKGAKGIRFKSIDCDRGDYRTGPDSLSSRGWMHIWYSPWDKRQHMVVGTAHIKITFLQHGRFKPTLTKEFAVKVDPDGTSRLSPRLPSVSLWRVPANAPRWRPAPTVPVPLKQHLGRYADSFRQRRFS